jgi:diphthamide biosynthesis protein 3
LDFPQRKKKTNKTNNMSGGSSSAAYDEVDLEDMEWNEELKAYTYSCPCGDIFRITLDELHDGEEIARCPSCSLILTVVYDPDELPARE